MTISFERAGMLLHVVEKCSANPMFSAIAQVANIELGDINKEAMKMIAERADQIRKEESIAAQKKLEAAVEAEEDHPVVDNTEQAKNPTPEYVEPNGNGNAETVIDRRV